jgi:hypothetical protein
VSTIRTPAAWRTILATVKPLAGGDNPTRTEIDATEERIVAVLVAHGLEVFQARMALGGRAARIARWDFEVARELDGLAREVAFMALPTEQPVRRYLRYADMAVRDDVAEADVWALRDALMGTEYDPGFDPVPRWEAEALKDVGLRPEDEPRYARKPRDRVPERPSPAAMGWSKPVA